MEEPLYLSYISASNAKGAVIFGYKWPKCFDKTVSTMHNNCGTIVCQLVYIFILIQAKTYPTNHINLIQQYITKTLLLFGGSIMGFSALFVLDHTSYQDGAIEKQLLS